MESQPSPYAPPVQPEKKSKVWLWVLIGLLVACLACAALTGILSLIGYNVFNQVAETQLSTQFEQVITVVPQQDETGLPSAQEAGNPYIADVVMTRETAGENLDPVGQTFDFAPTDTVHAVVVIVDAPEGTTFEAVWYAEDVGDAADPNTLINQTELTASGSRNLDFTLAPETTWPAGTYRVEISVDGQQAYSIPFFVTE